MRRLIVASTAHDIHRNTGDLAASPVPYAAIVPGWDWLSGGEHLSVGRFWPFPYGRLTEADVIVGGGGLLSSLALFERRMTRISGVADSSRLVLWGGGLNTHHGTEAILPDYLRRFGMVGIRDYLPDSGYRWVPCVSCMLPELTKIYPRRNAIVVYDNWQFPTRIKGFPRMVNTCRIGDKWARLRAAIAFLASSQTVLTSSYHGALLATYLGCQVIVTRPFSSKFLNMKHPPILVTDGNWRAALASARTYPESLSEARDANTRYADDVRQFLGR